MVRRRASEGRAAFVALTDAQRRRVRDAQPRLPRWTGRQDRRLGLARVISMFALTVPPLILVMVVYASLTEHVFGLSHFMGSQMGARTRRVLRAAHYLVSAAVSAAATARRWSRSAACRRSPWRPSCPTRSSRARASTSTRWAALRRRERVAAARACALRGARLGAAAQRCRTTPSTRAGGSCGCATRPRSWSCGCAWPSSRPGRAAPAGAALGAARARARAETGPGVWRRR